MDVTSTGSALGQHGEPGLDAITSLDAIIGRVMADLLARSHLMRPGGVAAELARAARPLGVSGVEIYLADLEQRQLVPLASKDDRDGEVAADLPIDATLAGRAYQAITIQTSMAGGAYQLWIPLVNGTERLGVLGLTVADVGETMLDRYRTLASLAGMLVGAKNDTSDTYPYVQRSREMALQAELVWAFLPPRTFATGRATVAASLEPAYEVGGDAFDYALLGDHLHLSIFDALGHDLAAGLLASVCIASCRSTRRAAGSLAAVMARADHAIASQFGDSRFVTALLCDLDLSSGLLSWIPCGHPPPLLIRGNRTVKELVRTPQPPLGLAGWRERGGGTYYHADPVVPCTEKLEPGDRVLFYTDGVTEGRAADGTPFGLRRLSDFIIRHSAGLPAPETMRRLNRAIVDYQHGRLHDDATAILVEWQPRQAPAATNAAGTPCSGRYSGARRPWAAALSALRLAALRLAALRLAGLVVLRYVALAVLVALAVQAELLLGGLLALLDLLRVLLYFLLRLVLELVELAHGGSLLAGSRMVPWTVLVAAAPTRFGSAYTR